MDKLWSWIPGLKPFGQWFGSAVLGGAVVAFVTLFFNVQLEQDKKLLELRKEGYSTFFDGVVANWRGEQADQRKVPLGRFMIGVYGTKPTVEALWNFYDKHEKPIEVCPGDVQQWRDDIQIYQRMREELFGKGVISTLFRGDQKVDDEKLTMVIMYCRIPPN